MPRVSPEYLEQRREEILDGARRAFARHGFEGATVVRLEEEIGVSRGAIFHYFPSKEDLFIALAERESERLARLYEEQGLAGVVEAMSSENPEWLGTYLEVMRLARVDPAFGARWEQRRNELDVAIGEGARRDREAGRLRGDVPAAALARFIGIFLDGAFLQARTIGLPPDLRPVLRLAEEALAPRDAV
jgi:TetR/AcrR family transcriptional regulator, transcriptional repressor of aconitase